LNLACEGLLFGTWAKRHGDSKTEAHPRVQILMNLHIGLKDATQLRSFLQDQVTHDGAQE
jgi:hypothetical protein